MKNQVSILLIASAAAFTTNVWGTEDGSYTNYDAIVNELKASADEHEAPQEPDLNWDEVALQGGLSFVVSSPSVSIPSPEGRLTANSLFLKGFEAHVGANLFSKRVRGEVAFRNFVPEDFGSTMAKLRELQARLMFLPPIQDKNYLRMGFGLSVRNMDVTIGDYSASTTTPAASLILGFEHKFTHTISVGPDIAYYSPLNDSSDKSSFDGAIRLNASF
jgi:hypothetical protein